MDPAAYVIHSAPGRCRLKIPTMRHSAEYFEQLKLDLIQTEGVEHVQANPLTASVLVLYDDQVLAFEALKSYFDTSAHFELTDQASAENTNVTIWENAAKQLTTFDNQLKETTSGHMDFRSLVFIVFVVLAIRQLQRGAVFGPAATLLWYAVQLLMKKK